MAQIPFVGPTYNLRRRPQSVQRTVNLIPVPQEPGNERTRWVFKDAPGLAPFVDTSVAVIRISEAGEERQTEAGAQRQIEA